MSREIDEALAATFAAWGFAPVLLGEITFKTGTRHVWSGPGELVWNGNTFTNGDGSAGTVITVAGVQEGTEVKAEGTSVTLSGLDPVDLAEAMDDIQVGAPVKMWVGALNPDMTLRGVPYNYFSGTVDKPSVRVSPDTVMISLALENRMINHGRASNRKYTAADQHANGHPLDTGFNCVEKLNAASFKWGMA